MSALRTLGETCFYSQLDHPLALEHVLPVLLGEGDDGGPGRRHGRQGGQQAQEQGRGRGHRGLAFRGLFLTEKESGAAKVKVR